MSAQILLLDRVEFSTIKIEANAGEYSQDDNFPQLATNEEEIEVLTRSDLIYPPDQVHDPRHFVLTYGVKIEKGEDKDQQLVPYDIEIEAAGYFRYVGGDEFKEERRFRAVRFSGYQILYGAIREMVSNLTARGRHGLWHLPARNFGAIAESRANEDEALRKEAAAAVLTADDEVRGSTSPTKKPRKRTAAKTPSKPHQ